MEETLPQETPNAFGLHANAGIGFRLREAERFAEQLNSLQPRRLGGGAGASIEEKAKTVRLLSGLHTHRFVLLHRIVAPSIWLAG